MQTAVAVEVGIGGERLHHRLIEGLGVVGALQHDVAVGKDAVHISVGLAGTGDHISLGVSAHITGREPVLLRMHQNGVVLCGTKIQHRRQNLIADLDELHRLEGSLLGLGGDDCDSVSGEAHMAVQNQAVIGGRLREGLAGDGKAGLGHILPSVDIHNAGDLFGDVGPDFFHDGVGMGRTQNLDHQGILGGHIIGVDRLAQQKLHRIFFANRLVDGFIIWMFHSCLLMPCGNRGSCGCL